MGERASVGDEATQAIVTPQYYYRVQCLGK